MSRDISNNAHLYVDDWFHVGRIVMFDGPGGERISGELIFVRPDGSCVISADNKLFEADRTADNIATTTPPLDHGPTKKLGGTR